MNLPIQQAQPNPFKHFEDGSQMLADFIQSQPPYLRKNLGNCCTMRQDSYKHFAVKSDGNTLTFFGKRVVIRLQAHIPKGIYLLKETNIRRANVYPRCGIEDVDALEPPLFQMWNEGRLFGMTGEQAGEIVKFMQYGKDMHNFSSYVFTPTAIYAATARTFELPVATGLNMRMDKEALTIIFTEMMRYPQFLVGTAITTETGYSIHEENVLFAGLDWNNCVVAACDSASI